MDTKNKSIVIELQFRMDISEVERLVTYYLELEQKNNKIEITREILRYKRGAHGSPFHFLDFAGGRGKAVVNEDDFNKADEDLTKEEQDLDSPDILAVKGLGQFIKFKAAKAFRQLIENRHVSDFHINPRYYPRKSVKKSILSSRCLKASRIWREISPAP
ncbi:MAG: hypothetical protein LBC14_05480 [Desulfovibrio sp.]|nr:hypothetical protein [Desulfovibrio sp.]